MKRKINRNKEDLNVCKMSKASKLIGDFWSIMIIRQIFLGNCRFKDLVKNINGITTVTLSDRLKFLLTEDVLMKKKCEDSSVVFEYALTEKGMVLVGIIKEIENFGESWL